MLKNFNKAAQGTDQATTKNHREYGVEQRINASTFNNINFLKFFCTSLGYHKTFQATNFLFMYLGIYYSNLLFHVEFIKPPLKLLNTRFQLQFCEPPTLVLVSAKKHTLLKICCQCGKARTKN